MSHFTVLTAITLPEGVEDLLSQSSMQMSVYELVQATRSADIVNRIKTDTMIMATQSFYSMEVRRTLLTSSARAPWFTGLY